MQSLKDNKFQKIIIIRSYYKRSYYEKVSLDVIKNRDCVIEFFWLILISKTMKIIQILNFKRLIWSKRIVLFIQCLTNRTNCQYWAMIIKISGLNLNKLLRKSNLMSNRHCLYTYWVLMWGIIWFGKWWFKLDL